VDGRRRGVADPDPLILQLPGTSVGSMEMEAELLRAADDAGLPVPRLVDARTAAADEPRYLLSVRVEGETSGARIVRDARFDAARGTIAASLGATLAAIHRIEPSTVTALERFDVWSRCAEELGRLPDPHPVLEYALAWTDRHRPEPAAEVVVHGDFRLGNLIVSPNGLEAVIDWEGAHIGQPGEDIGWLCMRSWRFGGRHRVAGVGELTELLDAYASSGGQSISAADVLWWEIVGNVRWALGCLAHGAAFLAGERSVESAVIGRRVDEPEYDLLRLIDDAEAA
jgi:aminoglycoside phosphotransferase (APT) family kinase protein